VTVHVEDAITERVVLAARERDSRIEIVPTRRRSRSAARNDAAPRCLGDWCYLLDDDAELLTETVPALLKGILETRVEARAW
jgi:glycosyltransferase involved in cell wall biosynthesis